jgi:hypothetical protein
VASARADVVSFTLGGQSFMAISAGPLPSHEPVRSRPEHGIVGWKGSVPTT